MPDEPGRRWCALAQHRTASGIESGRRAQGREIRLDLAPGDKVMQIENDYDKEVYNGDIGYVADVNLTMVNSLPASMGVPSPMGSVSLTRWCRLTL